MKFARVSVLSAIAALAWAAPASGIENQTTKDDYCEDYTLSPVDYPCLTESIHVTGCYTERVHLVGNGSGGVEIQIQQSNSKTVPMVAVGMTTGTIYRHSGPLSWTWNYTGTSPNYVSQTLHSILHFVGPGGLGDLYLRYVGHITRDPTTGDVVVMFEFDDVLCH